MAVAYSVRGFKPVGQTVLDIVHPGETIDDDHFVTDSFGCDDATISLLDSRLPLPVRETVEFVSFVGRVRPVERKVLFGSKWTITGMGEPLDTCGKHLGLYSDGVDFTRTRHSCHKQSCPICSWKWEAKVGQESSSLLQYILARSNGYICHASFNPTLKVEKHGGKLRAVCDQDGRPLPAAAEGNIRAFKLATMRKFLEKYHDGTSGALGYCIILHPGRETERGSSCYYYSPHVHLITNFHFDSSRLSEMEADYLRGGFTFTVFYKDFETAIDWHDYRDKETGDVKNALTAKLIYNASHSLVLKEGRQRRWISYNGAWRPCLWDYEKETKKILVRSRNNRPMVKIQEERNPEKVDETQIIRKDGKITGVKKVECDRIFPKRDCEGVPMPELNGNRLKYLYMRKVVYYERKEKPETRVANYPKRAKSQGQKPSLDIWRTRLEIVLSSLQFEPVQSLQTLTRPVWAFECVQSGWCCLSGDHYDP